MAYVVIHTENAPPLRMELSGPVTVGRAIGCELWIDDAKLSRKHCRFEPRRDGRFAIADANSSNGTNVNGKKLTQPVTLHDEDEISVGTATIIYYAAKFISRRPADPVEASDQPAPATATRAMDQTSLMGAPPGRIMPTPKPRTASETTPEPKDPAVPLAFTRPPPRPIVHDDVADEEESA